MFLNVLEPYYYYFIIIFVLFLAIFSNGTNGGRFDRTALAPAVVNDDKCAATQTSVVDFCLTRALWTVSVGLGLVDW